jgi:anti-sigma regulatory factor (Ser/Thr protein kinase)
MQRRHFRIPAAQDGLRSVPTTLETFCKQTHIPASASRAMRLVLEEILSNIVKYAYAASKAGSIDLELRYCDHEFSAVVEDSGKPFNPLLFSTRKSTGPLQHRKPGGLGILFVKNLVDSAAYGRQDGRNRLTLTIAIPSP